MPPAEPRAYAVKFASDGSTFAVCVATKNKTNVFCELVDHRACVGNKRELAKFVEERAQKWPVVIDGRAGADSLIERLEEVPEQNIVQPNAAGMVSANAGLIDAIAEGRLKWFKPEDADETDEFTAAMTQAAKRQIGKSGGWGFDGNGADVAEAAALAVWQVSNMAAEDEAGEVFF